MGRSVPIDERLDKYSIPEPNSGCLLWFGPTTGSGYGALGVNGKTELAHRLNWQRHNGPIPAGMFLCHKCDTPQCIEPTHLFLGTQKDNLRDRNSKGRHIYGAMHKCSKLTETDVLGILASNETLAVLATRYGVSTHLVWRIRTGKNWPHLSRKANQ